MDCKPNVLTERSDEQLALNSHIEEDVQELVSRYLRIISIKSAQMSKRYPSADPDDLFSDGLMGLLKAIRNYKADKGASFATFADICVANSMKSAVSKAVRTGSFLKDEDFNWDGLIDDSASTEDAVINKEQNTEFYSRISDILTEKELTVLEFYLKHYSYQQISEEMNISEKSVDNALQRAKQKLKRSLGE